MLHILLTILKVIGILILVVLALILAVILIILFVPLRYSIHIRKEDGPPEGQGSVTWLLKLLKVNAQYHDRAVHGRIRAAFKDLKTFRFPEEAAPPKEAAADAQQGRASEKVLKDTPPDAPPAKESAAPEISGPETGSAPTEDHKPEDHKPEDHKPDEHQPEDHKPDEHQPEDYTAADSKRTDEAQEQSKIRAFLEAIPETACRLIEKICDLLLKWLQLPFDLYDAADSLAERTEKKIRSIQYKIEPFLSVEAEHMLRKAIRYLAYLIRGWKPRTVEGYLEFGTGQPDVTGELTGLIYMLLPDSADAFDLRPDFYNKTLRTDVTITGKIRLHRMFVVAVRILTDREFWSLIRQIRHKPPKKSGRHRRRHKKQ